MAMNYVHLRGATAPFAATGVTKAYPATAATNNEILKSCMMKGKYEMF